MKKIMWMNSLLMALILVTPVFAQTGIESTYVMMHGLVTSYGAFPAFGWCGAFAEVDNWAQVFIGWAPGIPPIPPEEPPANFTYSFYAANLTDTTLVKLDYNGADLYISGLWNVYNVTFVYEETGGFSINVDLIVANGEGTQIVTGGWTTFVVAITGIEEIAGTVINDCVKLGESIPIGDVSSINPGVPDNTINLFDLVHTAQAYGSTPGIMNYDFSIDFNFDFTIDIYDLTTIAVNLGESY